MIRESRKHRTRSFDRVKAQALIDSGKSNLEIADALGCAPNTVPAIKRELGYPVRVYANRGLSISAALQKRRAEQAAENKRALDARRANLLAERDRLKAQTAPNPKPVARSSVPREPVVSFQLPHSRTVPQEGGQTTLGEIEAHQCRWPLSESRGAETIMCGLPVAAPGKSYCAAHATSGAGKGTQSEQHALDGLVEKKGLAA